jgi:hypothetical protein
MKLKFMKKDIEKHRDDLRSVTIANRKGGRGKEKKPVIDQEMRQSLFFFENSVGEIEGFHLKNYFGVTNQLPESMIEDSNAEGVQVFETFHLIDAMIFQ